MTTTYTEPTLLDESLHPTELLDAVADHWLPARQDDRAVIEAAIDRSLAEVGEVHISHVRARLAREVEPHMTGAVISAWAKRHGVCIDVRPNGDTKSGNGAKLARVWRLKTP